MTQEEKNDFFSKAAVERAARSGRFDWQVAKAALEEHGEEKGEHALGGPYLPLKVWLWQATTRTCLSKATRTKCKCTRH